MSAPTLDLLRRVFDAHIRSISVQLIKASASPSQVYRVHIEYRRGSSGLGSVIVKSISPEWPSDPCGPDRERFFYTRLLPRLRLKHGHVLHVGVDPQTATRVIVMQDLSAGFTFPPPTHAWTADEARCLLRTYARLHVQGQDCLPLERERSWLLPRYEERLRIEDILGMAATLVREGTWPPLAHLQRLFEQTLFGMRHWAPHPATLLHNDVYPPNGALPRDLRDECILVDWEMAGWGLAEMDLAYMFMQPFRSERLLNRQEMLDYYWQQRLALEGRIPPADERWARQRHSDAVLALWLVPVAHRVAARPYPLGSAPRAYWDGMFGVLYQRLRELCTYT
jgi:hypothetical protein